MTQDPEIAAEYGNNVDEPASETPTAPEAGKGLDPEDSSIIHTLLGHVESVAPSELEFGFVFSKSGVDMKLTTCFQDRNNPVHANRPGSGCVALVSRPYTGPFDGRLSDVASMDVTLSRKVALLDFAAHNHFDAFQSPLLSPPTYRFKYGEEEANVGEGSAVRGFVEALNKLGDPYFSLPAKSIERRILSDLILGAARHDNLPDFGFATDPVEGEFVELADEAAVSERRFAVTAQLYKKATDLYACYSGWITHQTGDTYEAKALPDEAYGLVFYPFLPTHADLGIGDLTLYEALYVRKQLGLKKMGEAQTMFMTEMGFLSRYERPGIEVRGVMHGNATGVAVAASMTAMTTMVSRGSFMEFYSLIAAWYISGRGVSIDLLDDEGNPAARPSAFLLLRCFLPSWAFRQGRRLEQEVLDMFEGCPNQQRLIIVELLAGGFLGMEQRSVNGSLSVNGLSASLAELDGGHFRRFERLMQLSRACASASNPVLREQGRHLSLLIRFSSESGVLEVVRYMTDFCKAAGERVDFLSPRPLRDANGEALVRGLDESLIQFHPATVFKGMCYVKADRTLSAETQEVKDGMEHRRNMKALVYRLVGGIISEGSKIRCLNFITGWYYDIRAKARAALAGLPGADPIADRFLAKQMARDLIGNGFSVDPRLYSLLDESGDKSLDMVDTGVLTPALIDRFKAHLNVAPMAFVPVETRLFEEQRLHRFAENVVLRNIPHFSELGVCMAYALVRGEDLVVESFGLPGAYFITYNSTDECLDRASFLTVGELDHVPASMLHRYVRGKAMRGPVLFKASGKVSCTSVIVIEDVEPISKMAEDHIKGDEIMDIKQLTKSASLVPTKVQDIKIPIIQSHTLSAADIQRELVSYCRAEFAVVPSRAFVKYLAKVHPFHAEEERDDGLRMNVDSRESPEFYVTSPYLTEVKQLEKPNLAKAYLREGAELPAPFKLALDEFDKSDFPFKVVNRVYTAPDVLPGVSPV